MQTTCIRCHRPLSDPTSVAIGIGPICNSKGVGTGFGQSLWQQANYAIIDQNETRVLIKDIGPWDKYMTITNAAETVVAELAGILAGRELHYIDSEGETDQLLVKDGRFAGFKFIDNARRGKPTGDVFQEMSEQWA